MISDNDRINLIKYRLQQSEETILLAEFLKDSGKYGVCVNRIYYGIYYALTALAIKHRFETSKHLQLIGWFNKVFVASNRIDKRFGQILRNSYQNRTKGDYDAFVDFSLIEVEEMIENMKLFISQIHRLIDVD